MRIGRLGFMFAAFTFGAGCHRAPPATRASATEQHFSIVLRDSSTRWTAHCESGCTWTDLSFQCRGCQWRLDADGVSNYDLDRRSSGFAFLLSSDGSGWRAKGLQGVRWIDLSYTCGDPVCRSRVDETGVEGL